jgi:Ribbon-helix-helix domain
MADGVPDGVSPTSTPKDLPVLPNLDGTERRIRRLIRRRSSPNNAPSSTSLVREGSMGTRTKKTATTTRITVSFDREQFAAVSSIAKRNRVPKAWLVRHAVSLLIEADAERQLRLPFKQGSQD